MIHKLSALYALVRNDARVLWFALRHPGRPVWLVPAVVALAVYLISPIDLIPDGLPLIGVVDDLVVIPLVISWLVGRLPSGLRQQAEAQRTADEER